MKNKHILSLATKPIFLLLALLLPVLAGCSWSDPVYGPSPKRSGSPLPGNSNHTTDTPDSLQKSIVVQTALGQIGVPYRYGGNNPYGFDCSGLVQYSHSKAGISVPRTTSAQLDYFNAVSRAELQSGDLVFFKIDNKQLHVAIMINEHEFVHAPSSGKTVSTSSFSNPYWNSKFLRATRP